MERKFSNKDLAELLRSVYASYQIKGGNPFQIRAYELAADGIEHSTRDIKDIWEDGKLDDIPGVGKEIASHLDELFKTGRVKHFEKIFEGIPESVFQFLKVPGVGPKTAMRLAEAGAVSIEDLEERIKSGWLLEKGFGQKTLDNILRGIEEFKKKSDRILLPVAGEIAKHVIRYLKESKEVLGADTLGSLRRKVSTVGDIDISVSTKNPKEVIDHFTKYSGTKDVIESGERTSTIALHNGIHVDLMVQPPENYGALLHHFTGSKNHNIKMRSLVRDRGYSISEQGVKDLKTEKRILCKTEEEVYTLFKMQTPPPEVREDTGEIEAAIEHKLPKFIELSDIKGDLHTHSLWSDGRFTIAEMAQAAADLGREYIALTDHSYPSLDFDKRLREIEKVNASQKKIKIFSGLEVNINADATLQVSDEILAKHEVVLVSIHTAFRQTKEEMTNRIITALENPNVDIFAHPTGRLLLEREGIDADWVAVFKTAAKLGKIMEINSFPNRLDLPDTLIREAKKYGVKFSIDTDSHQLHHLSLTEYGVYTAKRGWVEKSEVINSLSFAEVRGILKIV